MINSYTEYLLTVAPITAPNITATIPLSGRSFTVRWMVPNPDYYRYIITWTNLHTNMMEGSMTVSENTNSHTVTGLNGVDNY